MDAVDDLYLWLDQWHVSDSNHRVYFFEQTVWALHRTICEYIIDIYIHVHIVYLYLYIIILNCIYNWLCMMYIYMHIYICIYIHVCKSIYIYIYIQFFPSKHCALGYRISELSPGNDDYWFMVDFMVNFDFFAWYNGPIYEVFCSSKGGWSDDHQLWNLWTYTETWGDGPI